MTRSDRVATRRDDRMMWKLPRGRNSRAISRMAGPMDPVSRLDEDAALRVVTHRHAGAADFDWDACARSSSVTSLSRVLSIAGLPAPQQPGDVPQRRTRGRIPGRRSAIPSTPAIRGLRPSRFTPAGYPRLQIVGRRFADSPFSRPRPPSRSPPLASRRPHWISFMGPRRGPHPITPASDVRRLSSARSRRGVLAPE